MARISGVDLPRDKRIEIGLTRIFGIGLPSAKRILAQTGVNPDIRVKDLTTEDEQRLREVIESMKVEGDLKREIASNIKRLTDIGCYRGLRHRRGLPVRGQRTKTNARTRKGPKSALSIRPMVAGRGERDVTSPDTRARTIVCGLALSSLRFRASCAHSLTRSVEVTSHSPRPGMTCCECRPPTSADGRRTPDSRRVA